MSACASSISGTRLATYLEQHVEGFRGPLSLEKFDQGQSNPTFLASSASGRYVLRRKPPGELLASAHAVDREYRVLCALAGNASDSKAASRGNVAPMLADMAIALLQEEYEL